MPYINQDQRDIVDEKIEKLHLAIRRVMNEANGTDHRPGVLNYTICQLINKLYPDGSRYIDYNEVMGVLSCIEKEIYRRRIAIYEDLKAKENGDLFE